MKCEYKTEDYCLLRLPLKYSSAFDKFRCWVNPICIATGRYGGLDLNRRTCPLCKKGTEDEEYIILQCLQYDDIGKQFLTSDSGYGIHNSLLPMILKKQKVGQMLLSSYIGSRLVSILGYCILFPTSMNIQLYFWTKMLLFFVLNI